MNSKRKMKNVQLSCLLLQIAFYNLYVMDSGETAVRTGARAKTEYRGLGITAQVKQASLRAARTNFSKLKTEVQVATDSAFYDQFKRPNPKRVMIIYKHVSIHPTSLVIKVVKYFLIRCKDTWNKSFFTQYHHFLTNFLSLLERQTCFII